MSTDDEQWRPIPGHDGYEASSHGRIRNATTGRPLRPQSSGRKGYHKVHLGRSCQRLVHVLVCLAWHGPAPAGHTVDHIDWDRTHNVPANLRWLPAAVNSHRHQMVRERGQWVLNPDAERPVDWQPMPPEVVAELDERLAAAGW